LKNRAKCKKCQSIIESFHLHDHVTCKCGEISVSGGNQEYICSANDWGNFLRVDDLGNEVIVKVMDKVADELSDKSTLDHVNCPKIGKSDPIHTAPKPTREDKLKMLDEMIKSYETLPKHAIEAPITGYDLVPVLLLVKSLLS